MNNNNTALIKAFLLSEEKIQLHPDIDKQNLYSSTGNIGKNQWIFIRISKTSRVRMSLSENANLTLVKANADDYFIQNSRTHERIIEHVTIERILAHAPEQLFFLLYKDCTNGCLFCPLTYNSNNSHYSWEKIQHRITENSSYKIQSISFTTSYPNAKTQNELVEEIADIAAKTRRLLGKDIPIGASLKTPSKDHLLRLKDAGISEIRLNLETYNMKLAQCLMPNKDVNEILHSIEQAVTVYGKEKVSSNIIIGLGESDDDILGGVNRLAEIGALSTLYPYDSIGLPNYNFERPSAKRIYNLAVEHKKILEKYSLNPLGAKTMCCACAASHLYPGKDI